MGRDDPPGGRCVITAPGGVGDRVAGCSPMLG